MLDAGRMHAFELKDCKIDLQVVDRIARYKLRGRSKDLIWLLMDALTSNDEIRRIVFSAAISYAVAHPEIELIQSYEAAVQAANNVKKENDN